MRFINILKSNIDEKYLNLLDGKTSNVAQGFSADNVEKFTKKLSIKVKITPTYY